MFTRRNLAVMALAFLLLCTSSVSAGTFRKTKHFDGTYLLGVCSVEEFDYYAFLYPGIDEPVGMTFYRNGTVDIMGEMATYTSDANTITINYIPPSTGYFSTVQYILHRESGNNYWGEILFDGNLYGIIRGRLTN
jgi:hypothetical protein